MTMATTEIHIKNMVCDRCIMAVRQIFRKAGIEPLKVELGTVLLEREPDPGRKEDLRNALADYGCEMIDDRRSRRRSRMLERIMTAVIELVHYSPDAPGKVSLSEYLSGKCHSDYSALSKLFTEVKGMTIERYCILQKVEYVKELLFYGELSVSEIADRLHYSSVAHLSSQFKSVTGISPSAFRGLKGQSLTPIDSI